MGSCRGGAALASWVREEAAASGPIIAARVTRGQAAAAVASVAPVRLVRFCPELGRELGRLGSGGLIHVRLAASSGEAALSVVDFAAGGRIARHPAASAQVLAVVSGWGVVSGGGGEEQPIDAGTAAVLEAGEEHETHTAAGLVALALEGAAVRVLAEP